MRATVLAAHGRERQAAAYPNPTVVYSREQTSGAGQSNSQNIAVLDQPIELGGVRAARANAARLRREIAEARVAYAQLQLDFEVTRAYALALAADRRAELADQAAGAFSEALRVSQQRFAAGDVSGYANRRLRLEAARYATIRAEAALARRSGRVALAALVAPSADSITLIQLEISASPVGERRAANVDSLVSLALRARADLKAAELESQATLAEAELARRERLPVPVFSGGLKTEQASTSARGLTGFAAGISVPLPLWDRRAGAIAAAQAESRRRIAEAEAQRRRVAREVAEAYDAYDAAEVQRQALAPQLGAEARTALRSAQIAYSEGEITLVEWLDAVRAYREAEASFASLEAEVLIRRAALERAVGAPITQQTSSRGETGMVEASKAGTRNYQ